jgi:hypothetical protein
MPRPPENVRLVYADGVPVAVDTAYQGWDPISRTDVWEVISYRTDELPVQVLIDRMPPRTSIRLDFDDDDPPYDDPDDDDHD